MSFFGRRLGALAARRACGPAFRPLLNQAVPVVRPAVRRFATAAEVIASNSLVKPGYEKYVGVWLAGTTGFLFSMILIGGYTRLTGSGLSMTSWKWQGASLPRTQEKWEEEFEIYKQYPEYQRLHNGLMTLDEFKQIYFVEWFHRMWGRGAGVFFAIPLGVLIARKAMKPALGLRLTGLLGLGFMQAVVGWWMVRSGFDVPEEHAPLSENKTPRVSPYRIASHWTTALILYSGTFWYTLEMLRAPPALMHPTPAAVTAVKKMRVAVLPAVLCIGITLLSGPFVAGNHAGYAYNTWPKMHEDWVPPEWTSAVNNGVVRAFFESTPVVQFNHRMLAYATVATSVGAWLYSYSVPASPALARASAFLAVTAGSQMLLGIATLLMIVPVEMGVAHQGGAIVTLSTVLYMLHTLRLPGGVAVAAAQAAAGASASTTAAAAAAAATGAAAGAAVA